MKRKRKLIGLLVSLAVLLGIGGVTAAALRSQPEKDISAQTVSQPKDLTVAVEGLKKEDLEGKAIQQAGGIPCFSIIYDGPQMLLRDADVAVYARIDDLTYFHFQGTAWTKMDLTILDPLKGGFQANDRISIIQYGGYIPLNQESGYLDHPERYSGLTEKELCNTIIKMSLDSEPQPKIGQTGVFFAVDEEKNPGFPDGSYEVIGCYQGKYLMNESGILERYAPVGNYYSLLNQNAPETRSAETDLLPNGERPYTYEQMKELLAGQ